MPSLSDATHDGWLCTFIYNRSWTFYHLAAGQLLSGQPVRYGKGNRYGTEKAGGTARPSRRESHLLGHSPPASQAGRRVGPASIAFGLIVKNARLVVSNGEANFFHLKTDNDLCKHFAVTCRKLAERLYLKKETVLVVAGLSAGIG
jgi:hypothetical protein